MRPGQSGESLSKLVAIMQKLLGPGGCPWDQEQTLKTLTPFVIEEAHEVVDAIEKGAPELLREELGDLLLQIVFQAELARKEGWFGPDDVVDAICEKLIRRHPHVFGDEKVSGSAEVLQQWEILKAKEKKDRGALDGVPVSLPGLLRAVRVGEKASRFGYDWKDVGGVRAKVNEELHEFDEAVAANDMIAAEQELGDVLFALASVARKTNLDPEAALRGTLARFTARFSEAEKRAKANGTTLDQMTDAARDALWEEVKSAAR